MIRRIYNGPTGDAGRDWDRWLAATEEPEIEDFPLRLHLLEVVAWPPGQLPTGYRVDVWARTSEIAHTEAEAAVRALHGAGTDTDVVDAVPSYRDWPAEVRELEDLVRDLSPAEMRAAREQTGEPIVAVPWPDEEQAEYRAGYESAGGFYDGELF
jgi:hypothetical protein